MAETQTAEEIRAECVAAMPDPLGERYFALRNQLAWLHLKWINFRGLFADTQETIDLLNETAPDFFGNLQRMMWEDMILHLCRLTDPAKSAGKDTLTVRRIGELIPDQQLKERVVSHAEKANNKTQFARNLRNRRLAHRELPPLAGETPVPLAHASRQDVEDALAALRQTMNCVAEHYLGATVGYEHSIEALGGVASLLSRLKLGVDARRAELDRLRGL
ncbi:MAG: hypothetical protein ACQESR_28900 [Planctomycetota bacterium]